MESRGSNLAMISPYSILGSLISNIEVRQKSNLALLSPYSLMIICPNIEYGDRKRQKLLYSMMEEHQNIEFSDKIAIFDIWAGAGRVPEYPI